MHHLFREELDAADGRSEFVIALNLDIRGFSDWSLKVDSAQTALYLKKLYAKLIDTFFQSASFIKPTGDGLLVIETIQEENLVPALSRSITNSKKIVEGFSEYCSDEAMINFAVPEKVGIGLARGSASRLASSDRTLDYSGHVLNLASRLMDLARPEGLVVDGNFGLPLLEEDLAGEFKKHAVYLKGVSPNTPIDVFCWPASIQIPSIHLKSLEEEDWKHKKLKTTRREMEQSSARFYRFDLAASPLPATKVTAEVSHAAPTPGGRKARGRIRKYRVGLILEEVAGSPTAKFDQKALVKRLKRLGVGPTWPVTVRVSYRIA